MKPNPTLLCALLALSASAFACKPVFSPHPRADFIARSTPSSAIFLGEVVSASEAPDAHGNLVENILFHPTMQWMGTAKGDIPARGFVTRIFETDCSGLFDFLAKPGEQWLIFGESRDGFVYPESGISLQIVNGKIPQSILALLHELRSADKSSK